jgi:hypothetical protein
METLRSLRHVTTRIPKPGSARRAPVTTTVRVLATCGVLVPALALAGIGAAEAATVVHASSGSHTSAQSMKPGHSAKTHSSAATRCRATDSPAASSATRGPWMLVIYAKGPWMLDVPATRGPWMLTTSAKGPWMLSSPACATGGARR